MVDFHAHILPNVDDGAESIQTSLEMLHVSKKQGVDLVFATSHFYGDEEDPRRFLRRTRKAYEELVERIAERPAWYPHVVLGAEVLYFPGISQAEEVAWLRMGQTNCILIEPPMRPWSDHMLDELEQMEKNLRCIPVIAHLDRYIRVLQDTTLFERLQGRRFLIQVNANMFLRPGSRKLAMEQFFKGNIHLMGSDCHNMSSRAPNMGDAIACILQEGGEDALKRFDRRISLFLGAHYE